MRERRSGRSRPRQTGTPKLTTVEKLNRAGEEAGRSHSTTAPNSAHRMPRVLDVEVIHEASQTNGSDTPSAVRQVRGYAVVTTMGNHAVERMSSTTEVTASNDAVILGIKIKMRAQSSPSSQKLVTCSPTIR